MSGAVYSDAKILKEMKDGHIVIEPFIQSQLNNCSYNVTISEFFFRERIPDMTKERSDLYLNPWSESHIGKRWERGIVGLVEDEEDVSNLGLNLNDKYISLQPFETILVATNEFIGGREHITAEMRGRSSGGRALLSVCGGAGWGDVGYINRWTLMVTNLSRFATLVLPIGYSIAQIVFLECGRPLKLYDGKYQNNIDHSQDVDTLIERLKSTWSPSMMLPQLFRETLTPDVTCSARTEYIPEKPFDKD